MANGPNDHHTMSPSSWGRIDKCPASVPLSANAPEIQAGAGADRGTRIHAAALLNEGYDDLNEYDKMFADKYRAFVDDECRVLSAELGLPDIHFEKRLVVYGNQRTGERRGDLFIASFGTADEIHVYPSGRIIIYDLKTHPTGELPEHLTTCQGIAYAVGCLQAWDDATQATFVAYAPASGKEFVFDLNRDDLDGYEKWIGGLTRRVKEAQALPVDELANVANPGSEQCKYCRAASICPAAHKTMDVVRTGVDAGLPPGLAREGDAVVVADEIALAQFFEQVEVATRVVSAAKSALKEALSDVDSEYLELKERRGRVAFTDEPRIKGDLPNKIGRVMTSKDFRSTMTCSVTKLRKMFIERMTSQVESNVSKKDAGEMFDEAMSHMIDRAAPSEYISWRKRYVPEVVDVSSIQAPSEGGE